MVALPHVVMPLLIPAPLAPISKAVVVSYKD